MTLLIVVAPGAVRHSRSDPRPRRRLLRLHAAVAQLVRGLALALVAARRGRRRRRCTSSPASCADAVRPRASSRRARRHLALLAAALFLVLALGAWLEPAARARRRRRASSRAPATPTSHARMPAALALDGRGARRRRPGAAATALTPRNWPLPGRRRRSTSSCSLGGEGYATMLQRFVVTPNEQVRETPYIEHNIAATRRAFALDRVEERELSGDAQLTRADIERNAATLDNVRLWDHQPLLETFGQIQEIRTYYDFVSVDNDRYEIDGQHAAGDAVGARAELGEPAEPHLGQRAPDVHARLRPDARPGEPGDRPKGCRCCSSATCRRSRPSTSTIDRAEHLLRRAVERLRHRPDRARRSSTIRKGDDNVYTQLRRHRRHAARLALAEAAVRAALPRLPDPAERRHHAREPACCSTARSASASRRSRRS